MRRHLAAGIIGLFVLVAAAQPGRAMQFERVAASAGEVFIGGRGPIVPGDVTRLKRMLAAVPQGSRLVALAFDSPGGSVREGVQLAGLIKDRGLAVFLPPNSKCASACFLLFAASPHRFAAPDALVGVHSASEDGGETGNSLAVTTLMARIAGDLGTPPAIIGKMVQTKPGRVEWLTAADLRSMDVTILDPDQPAPPALRPPSPAPVAAPGPTPLAASPGPATPVPDAAAGSSDRRGWEAWLAGLRGATRDGAMFAVAQLGAPHPLACTGPNGARLGDFTAGCEAARQRLAPVEAGLRNNAAYAAGWNGAGPVPAAPEAVQAEYRGAYFCGRQAGQLTVRLFMPNGGSPRRALIRFGPLATSPEVPSGGFLAEGSIAADGGALRLAPAQWVTRPAGYAWFGLAGRSEDGGRTFAGQVTDSSLCTRFTLQRAGAAATR